MTRLRPHRGPTTDHNLQLPPASARVFAIPELLEHILIHIVQQQPDHHTQRFCLPTQMAQARSIKSLYILQRVNRTFQSTISRSNTCRRAMFLEHAWSTNDYKSLLQINPLIFDLFPVKASVRWRVTNKHELMCQYTLTSRDLHTIEDSPMVQELMPQPAPQQTIGSWRRILLGNMPVKIEFNFNISDGRDYSRINRHYWLDEDATFADLVLLFVQDVRRQIGFGRRRVMVRGQQVTHSGRKEKWS